jgi:hypothetical protein
MATQATEDGSEDSIERGSVGGTFGSRDARHVVTLTDPSDYDDAVESAEKIGLELSGAESKGCWETHRRAGFALGRRAEFEVIKAGRKWFHIEFPDGETARARPRSSNAIPDGALRLLFD